MRDDEYGSADTQRLARLRRGAVFEYIDIDDAAAVDAAAVCPVLRGVGAAHLAFDTFAYGQHGGRTLAGAVGLHPVQEGGAVEAAGLRFFRGRSPHAGTEYPFQPAPCGFKVCRTVAEVGSRLS